MEILFSNRKEWRSWLEENSTRAREVWLIYYKKHVHKESITYEQAVREALCFGWIDSMVKRIDHERYMQKYTPRKPKSNWSETNKKRVEDLIREGLMTPSGLFAIERAKENGSWNNLKGVDDEPVEPQDLIDALAENPQAEENYYNFPRSTKKQYVGWLKSARRQETRLKRIKEIVLRAEANKKAGLL
ncbi:MAG: YdeI/OmpD-associated family protein [Spirochaetaceae bacterium]|nr:YdeI/OmpD-associated family protein [Spirochaetaceae bacterium]